MARIETKLSKRGLVRVPTPGAMADLLLVEKGYLLFAGIKEEDVNQDIQVPVFIGDEMVGIISYIRNLESGVTCVITDTPNSKGDILTQAANNLKKHRCS